ncbi:phosphodiester glycosidase family protein [Rothia nasimurium]|uniref:Phosphodiester glycosidase family protein n=1 Tax=Rothia nasimurium TaxID=85336 RepID=A0A4Y9F3H8_9MICC|nr:phosphodiester glycosidase family protein [Rothia nasimurium]MBF0808201.1 phosphodiester glycosidase family protein [Rothia nasimurium]TFU22368.1 phosphodiester glycosidase family protein [Rothia nasimurium]
MNNSVDQNIEQNPQQPQAEQKTSWVKSKTTRRTALIGGLGLLGTAGLGGGWAYNRYLRDHTEIADVAAYEAQAASNSTTSAAASDTELTNMQVTDTGVTADNGSIALNTIVLNEGTSDQITAYTAEVKLGSASILRSAFANNQFGLNIVDLPSNIGAEHNAIWAINGDYYGFRETGIVVRNGVVYRDSPARTGLAFYADGSVKIYDETATTAQALVDKGVLNTLSFGPALVENGAILDGIEDVEVDTNFGNHSIQGEQPRTAVGVIGTNHLLFMVVDGRSEGYSRGATMTELAQMMIDAGCTTAYNIDGGGSSVMIFNDSLVNNPLGKGEERETSDILYIAGA